MDNKVLLIVGILTLIILGVGVYAFAEKPAKDNSSDVTSEIISSSEENKTYSSAPAMQIDQNKKYTAIMETSKGTMTFELFASENPITVNNFVFLAKDGFYDGISFHRIMKDFMIQSGDPKGDGTGGPGYKFDDEAITRDYERGTLAMANSGVNTNGSQFFIMHKDNPLPKNYVIFGKLTDSFETLDLISNTEVKDNGYGEMSKPLEQITISHIEIIEE